MAGLGIFGGEGFGFPLGFSRWMVGGVMVGDYYFMIHDYLGYCRAIERALRCGMRVVGTIDL